MNTRSRLVHRYRSLGLKRLTARIVRRAVAAVYSRRAELLIVKRLDPPGAENAPPTNLRIEPITTAHAPGLATFNERYRTRDKVVATAWYLKHDYRGFLAVVDGAPVGYWWWVSIATDPAVTHPCIERFALSLKDDEIFAFDYFIVPDQRVH